MIWKIKSFGSLDLLTDYSAFIGDDDNPNVQPPVSREVIETGATAPAEAGMTRKEDYLVITVMPRGINKESKNDALKSALSTLATAYDTLVGLDNENREWYVMGGVVNHVMRKGVSKITLQVADSVWRRVNETSTDWNITASGETLDIEVGGNVEVLPIFELETVQPKIGSFGYRKWVRLYNSNSDAVLNEMVDIGNAAFDTSALVGAGKMLSSGDDLRVYDQGTEVSRFLYGINTTTTKVFAGPFDFQAKIEMTLKAAIAGSGAVTVIYINNTVANQALLARMPQKGLIEIDNERFVYTSHNKATMQINIGERAVRKSVAAAHSINATVKWLEHDCWLYYGNVGIDAPEVNNNHEPAYDIATSTNASRVHTSFGDKAGLRPGAWRGAVLARTGTETSLYSGNHGSNEEDPITDMGMALKSYLKSGAPAAENGSLEWRLMHRGQITSVTVPTAEKRRTSTSWPSKVALQKSKDGITWVDQFNEATPASLSTWGSITNTTLQSLGAGYKFVRFFVSGAIAAILNGEADLEVDAVTVVVTYPITATLQAEENNYALDCEIKNVTTGESLYLKWTMGIGDVLTADTEKRTVLHSDGTNAFRARTLDALRTEWLPLKANAVNQLQFIDAGTQEVNLSVRYVERRTR